MRLVSALDNGWILEAKLIDMKSRRDRSRQSIDFNSIVGFQHRLHHAQRRGRMCDDVIARSGNDENSADDGSQASQTPEKGFPSRRLGWRGWIGFRIVAISELIRVGHRLVTVWLDQKFCRHVSAYLLVDYNLNLKSTSDCYR